MPIDPYDTNLESCWWMDEASGVRSDQTANSNDLTDPIAVGSSSDRKQGALSADFEASNGEYLAIADIDQTGLGFTGNFTLACWVKFESVDDMALVDKYDFGSSDRGYRFWIISDSGFYPRLNVSDDGSDIESVQADTAVAAGSWIHLACVYDGTDLRIYRNGELDCTPTAHSSGIHDSDADFRVGTNYNDTGLFFDGLMDELGAWSRALSAEEIASVYMRAAARRRQENY